MTEKFFPERPEVSPMIYAYSDDNPKYTAMMSDAIYKFKRYEDRSLDYTGINRHEGEKKIGLFDTVIEAE